MEIYPNPVEGNLLFIKAESAKGDFNCHVYDVLGKLLLLGVSKSEEPIDVSSLHSGLYVLELISPGLTGVKRFIVFVAGNGVDVCRVHLLPVVSGYSILNALKIAWCDIVAWSSCGK